MNVFVIRSPYCYLNAIEFKKKYNLEDKSCILLIGYLAVDSIDIQHFEKIVDVHDWQSVVYYPQNASVAFEEDSLESKRLFRFPGNKILFLQKYVKRINCALPPKQSVKRVILQNIDDYSFLHVANRLEPKTLYCLDEGPKSLWTTELRKKSYGRNSIEQVAQSVKRSVMDWLFGYQVSPLKGTTFFSCYDLEHDSSESLVQNTYEFSRENAVKLHLEEDLVYFIGSSLSEVGVLSESFYLECLEKVTADYSNSRIAYIAHRADSDAKLKKIEDRLGIPVINFDIPFELQLALNGPVPKTIISFYSSVLVNSHTMLQGIIDVISYRIPEKKINDKYRNLVNTVYAYFEELDEEHFTIKYLD